VINSIIKTWIKKNVTTALDIEFEKAVRLLAEYFPISKELKEVSNTLRT